MFSLPEWVTIKRIGEGTSLPVQIFYRNGGEPMATHEPTISFSIAEDREKEVKKILTTVYEALRQKGYNPINQIVGYILSEDPTYITNHNNARTLIRKIDRDELLQVLVRKYLGQ